jgi:hypothetical protein
VTAIATARTARVPKLLGAVRLCVPILFALASFGTARVARGQSAQCAELDRARAQTYGFSPPKLSDAQRKAKSDAMDAYWNKVKSGGPTGVACLQEMLQANRADSFFAFDGSALLMSLDQSSASIQVIASSLERTDLAEIQPSSYVGMSLALSEKGADIGALAEKYMRYPKVDSYLPQHAMTLDRTDGALILYGSMDPNVSEKDLEKLAGEKDGVGRSAALVALAMNCTEASFRAFHNGLSLDGLSPADLKGINSILRYEAPHSGAHPKLTHDAVLKRVHAVIQGDFEHHDDANPPYVAGDKDFETSARALLTPDDLPLVYEARRKSVRGVSDEGLDEYLSWTYTIVAVINRNDMYKELRPR